MSASATPSGEATVSERVLEAVAEAEGVDPTDVTPPLYEVVDSDALDQLFESANVNKQLVFSYDGPGSRSATRARCWCTPPTDRRPRGTRRRERSVRLSRGGGDDVSTYR